MRNAMIKVCQLKVCQRFRPGCPGKRILALKAGSSGLKFAVFRERSAALDRILSGSIDSIGQPSAEVMIAARVRDVMPAEASGRTHRGQHEHEQV